MCHGKETAPLVSIVTICLNAMPHIRTCIDSLLAQDYPNVEIVVQDGASTDGTLEVLRGYGSRILLDSERDSGHGEAMSRALKRCRGEIIGTCNADDLLLPHAASWAVAEFCHSPGAAAIYGGYCVIDGSGEVISDPQYGPPKFRFDRVLCVDDVIPMQSAFFRRRSLEDAGLMPAGWMPRLCEDFLFWVNLGLAFRIEPRPGVISYYRVHEGSGTNQPDLYAKIYAAKREVLERFFLRSDLPFELRSLRSRALGGLALSVAGQFLVHFDLPAKAWEYIALARLEQPDDRHLDLMLPTIESWGGHIISYIASVKEDTGRGDCEGALGKLRQMRSLDWWFPSLTREYAHALVASGYTADALPLLQRHVAQDPGDTKAANLLAICAAKQRGGTSEQVTREERPTPLQGLAYEWSSSTPKVDLILPGPPEQAFSWGQREGWAHALIEAGVLNNLYWAWDNERVLDQIFASLEHSKADMVLAMSCDHHMPFLHDTPQKREFWRSLHIPTICHCAERVIGSPFPDSEEKTGSAIETYDAFVYIDELAAALFQEKPSLWVPQYVDERLFRSEAPFEQRINQLFFRGQLGNSGLPGVYQQRNRLIGRLRSDGNFCLSEAYRPLLTPLQAAQMKARYRFVLNAPANCSGYSSSLYEGLACGCAVFQYVLPQQEVKSRELFTEGRHFIAYDADSPEDVARKAEYACRHWGDFAGIAEEGMHECLSRHTISVRLREILAFVERNFSRIAHRACAGYSPFDTSAPDGRVTGHEALPRKAVQQDAQHPEAHELPVHFFTIVLNGQPFIRHHIEAFNKLDFDWHWHIIEGVADLKHDTAWSVSLGGRISDDMHHNGLSCDGTSEYIEELARRFPRRVSIYRKPSGVLWEGKLEMVSAPLPQIRKECLLWQVDCDELWTAGQIATVREMFMRDPSKMTAFYYCHFFVGPRLVTTTRGGYGNRTGLEWLRTWRFRPQDRWASHEPPRLCREVSPGQWRDLAQISCFTHEETEAAGLVFQHFAYATAAQLRWKEIYYGYHGASQSWRRLNSTAVLPARLSEYFPWVQDRTVVDTVDSRGIVPLMKTDADDQQVLRAEPQKILWIRPDSIGDNVLAAAILPYLKSAGPDSRVTVVCQQHVAELYESSPYTDAVISFDKLRVFQDESYRKAVVGKIRSERADLALDPVYSRDAISDIFTIESGAPERVGFQGNLCNITRRLRDENNRGYTTLLQSEGEWKPELERHRDFLRGMGVDAPPLQPVIWTTPQDDEVADGFFRETGWRPDSCLLLFAGAQAGERRYPHYGRALAPICREGGFTVVAVGTAEEFDLNQENLDDCAAPAVNLSGKLSLRQTAALLKRCRLAVGAETGTAHIACAVGTPNVVLVGGGHFSRFMPYSPLTSVVCLPLACYCCNWRCSYKRAHCVKDLHPEVIAEAVRQTLSGPCDRIRVFCESRDSWLPMPGEPQWKGCENLLIHYPVQIFSLSLPPWK